MASLPTLKTLTERDFDYFSKHARSFNLPSQLIAAANPLGHERKSRERALFGEFIAEKRSVAEDKHRQFIGFLLHKIYPRLNTDNLETEVKSYYGKMQMIDSALCQFERCRKDPDCYHSLSSDFADELADYQRKLKNILSRSDSRESIRLMKEPVNLDFYMNPSGILAEPFLICAKKKVPGRIAGKIPYKMLDGVVRNHGIAALDEFRKLAMLRDGLIEDIYGVQIVTYGSEESQWLCSRIKRIKGLRIIEHADFRDLSRKNYQHYTGIHLNVVWEERERIAARHPYSTRYEIILMDFMEFLRANLGPRAYFARSMLQKEAIVLPQMENGRAKIIKLPEKSLDWKIETEYRIGSFLR